MASIQITLVRSPIGSKPNHRQCVKALGLSRMHQMVERQDTPEIRGLIRKIEHLVKTEEKS